MQENDIFNDMKIFFNVSSLEDVAEKMGYSRNTARTWRQNGITPNALNKFQYIKNDTKTIQTTNQNGYWIIKISHDASAGVLSDINGIEVYDTDEKIFLPSTFFKSTMDENKLRILQVIGDSMLPKLHSGDWVIIDINDKFLGDGLYVINYNNILMVKMLQFKPNGNVFIKSLNSEYDSYEVENSSQEISYIIGRVIKTISQY
jgi:hypothetical protein